MPRLKLTLAYLGTNFAGWQIQAGRGADRPRTVQEVLEQAVERLAGQFVRAHGAGRTDSGVHAEAQIAHLDLPGNLPDINWQRALNSLLPPDLSVIDARMADDSFHSRFSAIGKEYRYRLWLDKNFIPPALRDFVWHCGPLDQNPMLEAAKLLLGEHDFAAFQNRGAETESTVREIFRIDQCALPLPGHRDLCPQHQAWVFQGSGFLKQMVRNLVGLLVTVGQGRLKPADVPGFLRERNRGPLPFPTAPARGLCLQRVLYP